MGLPRAIQSARRTGVRITWSLKDGSAYDLTGVVALTGVIKPNGGTERAITGSLTITNAALGKFTWAYSENDLSITGTFQVQFKADYGSGMYDLTFPETWVVESAL
jgi:hypothetical protein